MHWPDPVRPSLRGLDSVAALPLWVFRVSKPELPRSGTATNSGDEPPTGRCAARVPATTRLRSRAKTPVPENHELGNWSSRRFRKTADCRLSDSDSVVFLNLREDHHFSRSTFTNELTVPNWCRAGACRHAGCFRRKTARRQATTQYSTESFRLSAESSSETPVPSPQCHFASARSCARWRRPARSLSRRS